MRATSELTRIITSFFSEQARVNTAAKEDQARVNAAAKEDQARVNAATKEDQARVNAATKEDQVRVNAAAKEDEARANAEQARVNNEHNAAADKRIIRIEEKVHIQVVPRYGSIHTALNSCSPLQVTFWGTLATLVAFVVAAFHKHVGKWLLDVAMRRNDVRGHPEGPVPVPVPDVQPAQPPRGPRHPHHRQLQ